jgi:MFS family permease
MRERLGRWAPALSRHERRLLWLLAAASFFNQYDSGLFALLLVQIQSDLAIPEGSLGFLGSIVRMGPVPAFLVLFVADRMGRRIVLLWTIVGYTALTAATAFAPSYEVFTALQLLSRMFMAAEYLLAIVVIVEEFDPGNRGFGIGALGVLAVLGRGVSVVLFGLVEEIPFGWRGLYLVGVAPLLAIAWFRRGLPETERFARLQRERPPTASLLDWLAPIRSVVRRYPARLAAVAGVGFLWSFSNGPADFFLPKFVQQVHGWSPAEYSRAAILAGGLGLTGFLVAGWVSDRIGRRPVALLFTIAEPLGAIVLFTVVPTLLIPILILWMFSSVANDVTLGTFRSEVFPTSARSTATGALALVGTVGSVLGLACEGSLFALFGGHWVPVRVIAVTGIAMPFIIYFGFPETSGRPLEEIAPESTDGND